MRIFRKEFSRELTDGMWIGECIITKVNDTEYGNFIIHKKRTDDGSFPHVAVFGLLTDAIECARNIEKNDQFEYTIESIGLECNDRNEFKKVLNNFGLNRWSLCGVYSPSDEGLVCVFKRKK